MHIHLMRQFLLNTYITLGIVDTESEGKPAKHLNFYINTEIWWLQTIFHFLCCLLNHYCPKQAHTNLLNPTGQTLRNSLRHKDVWGNTLASTSDVSILQTRVSAKLAQSGWKKLWSTFYLHRSFSEANINHPKVDRSHCFNQLLVLLMQLHNHSFSTVVCCRALG